MYVCMAARYTTRICLEMHAGAPRTGSMVCYGCMRSEGSWSKAMEVSSQANAYRDTYTAAANANARKRTCT